MTYKRTETFSPETRMVELWRRMNPLGKALLQLPMENVVFMKQRESRNIVTFQPLMLGTTTITTSINNESYSCKYRFVYIDVAPVY